MFLRNLPVAISVGVVPCPLSLTIMSTSIIYGIVFVGLSAVLAMTVSMTIVLYFIAVVAAKSKKELVKRKGKSISSILHRVGEIALLLVGLLFIYKGGHALWPILF